MNLAYIDFVGQNELCNNESHGEKIPCGLFCVTGKDLDCIDIDALY